MVRKRRRAHLMANPDLGTLHRIGTSPNLPQQLKPPGIGQSLGNQMNLFFAQPDWLRPNVPNSTHRNS